jgi:hypothetical protein
MFWLYLIVAIALFGFGMYKLGLVELYEDEKFALFWVIGLIAMFWPIALGLIVVFGPFVGLFWLGDRKRKQREQDKKSDK